MNRKPNVVIIGGGFGGLAAAKALAGADVQIILVDQNNYHGFQPLFFQAATAGLSPNQVASPIRSILRKQANVQTVLAQVTSVDLAGGRVHAFSGAKKEAGPDITLQFDYLVLASGARTNYRGNDAWMQFAVGLKDLDDAVEIRRRILLAFEHAEREMDPAVLEQLLNFVVIGGGPTGVELAGAIAELRRHVVAADFRSIHPDQAKVILIQGGDRILPQMPEGLSAKATRYLAKLGVDVRVKQRVKDINAAGVTLADGTIIPSSTVIWAAGVSASPITQTLGVKLDEGGRVVVENDLSIPNHPNAFAVGDTALFMQDGKPVPGLAPAAAQAGRAAAKNILRDLANKPRQDFRYVDKGVMATVGRSLAVAQFGRLQFGGFFAWLLWLVVHITFLIGFRNRMAVLFDWAWSYCTFQRGARLITGHRMLAGAPDCAPEEASAPPVDAGSPTPAAAPTATPPSTPTATPPSNPAATSK